MFTKICAAVLLVALLATQRVVAEESSQADIETQLQLARQKLEDAAHEVAELSTRLGSPLVDRLMMMGEGPSHAVIGVQLDAKDSKSGAHVRDVSPGGPAAQAGMRAGDVILSVNGADLKGDHPSAEVARLMRSVEPNSKVRIRVLRDGKVDNLEVIARPVENHLAMPGMPPHLAPSFEDLFPGGFAEAGHGSVAGMELVTLTPQLGAYFGTEKGVLVLRAPRNPGFELEDGDVILAIDGREPTSGSHATRILASYGPGEKVKMQLMRQRKKMMIDATVPEGHKGSPAPLASADCAQFSGWSFPALRCAAIPGTEGLSYLPRPAPTPQTPRLLLDRTALL